MKKLVVYYSLEGNTEYAAKKIAEELKADILKLEPEKPYPTGIVSKYLWGGRSAVMAEKPQLKPYDIKIEEYDYIIIGTPIWASTYTPPIRSFVEDNKIKGKNIAIFVSSSGGYADKCFNKFAELLEGNNIKEKIGLINPAKKKGDKVNSAIADFCKRIMK